MATGCRSSVSCQRWYSSNTGRGHAPKAPWLRNTTLGSSRNCSERLVGTLTAFQSGIECIAEAVAEERRGEDGDGERSGGEHRHVPVKEHEVHADSDHLAPARGRRLYADAEKAQRSFEHHGERDRQDEADDDRRHGIGVLVV